MMENQIFKDCISGKKALEIVFKLLDVLTCTECHRVLSRDLTVCRNGHIICQSCQAKWAKCSLCGRSFISSQSTLVEAILLQMPQECRYSGCPQVVLPGERHHECCAFKETTCRVCQAVGTRKEIPAHVRSHHSGMVWLGEHTVTTIWEYFDPNRACQKVWPVMIRDQFFWSVMQNDPIKNSLSKEYIWVSTGPTMLKIRVNIKFLNQETQGAYNKEKNLVLNPSLDSDPKPIVIGKKDLEQFIERGHVLKWTEIFTVEDPAEEVKVASPKSPIGGGVKVILDEFKQISVDGS